MVIKVGGYLVTTLWCALVLKESRIALFIIFLQLLSTIISLSISSTTFFLLQFEWAWQHPHISRRLSHVTRRTRKESSIQFHWRVLSNMLRVAPWSRLPLTVRWLRQEYRLEFEPQLQPPLHIPLTFGCVRAKKKQQQQQQEEKEQEDSRLDRCLLCREIVQVWFYCAPCP